MRPDKAQYTLDTRKAIFAAVTVIFIVFLTITILVIIENAQKADAEKIAFIPSADETPTRTFRKTYWGMTIAQVKATEESEPDYEGSESYLDYTDVISGIPCKLVYGFTGQMLYYARYEFPISKNNLSKKEALDLFALFNNTIAAVYGWDYTEQKRNFGLVYIRIWKSQNTQISLSIDGSHHPKTHKVIALYSIRKRGRGPNR